MGKLTTIYGPMFSGKTTELQNRCNNAVVCGKKVIVVKYALDNRYTNEAKIINHDGQTLCSSELASIVIVNDLNDISKSLASDDGCGYNNISLLIIDEAQFFSGLYDYVNNLYKNPKLQHLDIVIAGLDLDAKGIVFNEEFNMLILMADEAIYKLAKCYQCPEQAAFTIRIDSSICENQIKIGGADIYQPACYECFVSSNITL